MLGIKEYLIAGSALIVFLVGWFLNGYRWENKLNTLKLEYASTLQTAYDQAKIQQEESAKRYAVIDEKYTKDLANANDKLSKLKSDVAAGRVGLRINTGHCPDLSRKADSASVGDAGTPELDSIAGQAYYALREASEQVTAQLKLTIKK